MSRIVEQQGFSCEVFFDASQLVVASFVASGEPGGGSRIGGYWAVFEQPADLVDVVRSVRRAWWMRGTGDYAPDERTECELAICSLFDVDSHDEPANARLIQATHIGVQGDVVAEVRVVGSVWTGEQRHMVAADSPGRVVLPFDADDESIADALAVAMAASTGAGDG